MQAWSTGQPSGAAVVERGPGARTDTASTTLDSMVQLAVAAHKAIASGYEPAACKELFAFVETQVPIIKANLENFASDLTMAQAKIAVLESKVADLKKELEELRSTTTSSQHRVLLGEIAFVLDQLVSEFVMGNDKFSYTIYELDTMADKGRLNEGQHQRWSQFCAFLRRQGWQVHELCAESRVFKQLRRGDAHSTPAKKAQVSAQDLEKWIEEEISVQRGEAQRFLQLVVKFGKRGTPLVPVTDVSAVVNEP